MSTKNLARTVIEGGRDSDSKWQRRDSNSSLRVAVRSYRAGLRDPELAWSSPAPERTKVRRQFADKLGPVRRWLASACGRPWSDVRSEIFRLFDTRTLAGRHIVFDHMLMEVTEHGHRKPYAVEYYYVDAGGILRRTPPRSWTVRRTSLTAAEEADLRAFAGDRKIRHAGTAYFWLEMTFAYRWTKGRGFELQPTGRYRQTGRLTPDEVDRFTALRGPARDKLLDTESSHAL